MIRPMAAAVWLLVCAAFSLAAQTGEAGSDSADVLVLDHDFHAGSREFVRVLLMGKQVYRAELSTSDVTLEIRSPFERVELPRVFPIFDPAGSGMSVVEVYTEADAVYELRPVGSLPGGVATRLRLYRDVEASRRRSAILGRPGWEIGLELSLGRHSGFPQTNIVEDVSDGGEAGSDLGICFAARRAPGIPRLSMCAVGLEHQSQHGQPSILWIYSEPRVRLLGGSAPGRSNWELGALFRVGIGSVAGVSKDPWVLAPGGYLARHIRTAQDGRGWSLAVSYSHAYYKSFSREPRTFTDPTTGEVVFAETGFTPDSDRLSLAVGWYQ